MGSALTDDGVAEMDDEVEILGTAEVDTPAGKSHGPKSSYS